MLKFQACVVVLLLAGSAQTGRAQTGAPDRPGLRASATTRELYVSGETALRNGDLSSAERNFRQVLARNPGDPGANANLGVVYMRRRNWPAALRYLRNAARLV